jgi:cyclophilin family peptidyl-prolyl cis-trans isomerase/HEAT repeat protein
LLNSIILMYNLIIKKISYSHCLVICIFLFLSCGQSNQFKKDAVRHVYNFADERNSEVLIEYLQNKSDEIREHACLLFGSMNSNDAIGPLLKVVTSDKYANVRKAAAFSLGQYQQESLRDSLYKYFLIEENSSVKNALLVAIGKCDGAEILLKNRHEIESHYNEYLAEALFYSIRKHPEQATIIPWLIELLNNQGECRFYAASALSKMKADISSSHDKVKSIISDESNVSTRSVLIRCIAISGENDFNYIENLFKTEKEYLCRLSIVRGISSWKSSSSLKIIQLALSDEHPHVRETAAEYLLNQENAISLDLIKKCASVEKSPRTKYYEYEYLLSKNNSLEASVISELLKKNYAAEKDEYVRGYIVKALSADFNNLPFIEEECFNTTSILIREFSFEALLKIRSSKRFPEYAIAWKKTTKIQSLEDHFKDIILECIATYDVSLVALGAAYLRDSTLLGSSKSVLSFPSADVKFLEDAMSKMRLPRDIESYTELLKTMRFLEGKTVEGELKPDFNHPIDWDLVERIPVNQHISIVTDLGTIEAELWVNDAPGTVANFVKLIQDQFYTNKRLHRVVPGFVIQDGCPRGDGFGSTMQTIRSEFTTRNFDEGVLGMASAGPDTESCQWFITHTRTPHLNGRYTAFGKVTKGMDIVHRLEIGAKILRIELLPD